MSDDPSSPEDGSVPDDLNDLLDEIHENLDATQELQVERTASRWIGEAEAIAQDLAEADLDPDVVEEHLGKIESLLEEIEETGDTTADEHLQQAISLTESALDAVGSGEDPSEL